MLGLEIVERDSTENDGGVETRLLQYTLQIAQRSCFTLAWVYRYFSYRYTNTKSIALKRPDLLEFFG